ncbi:TolC family protein [Sinimarinibacterium sp. CAU 1509]|uniref:TolC family protein n=1 Tax=Sinimarinibacterium sp. CAU 1509 TaxID=2562283 RepID=UPI0010ACAECF|nr:TolC family protein [Sinimarinibacterium sp. CAU 1509]TJY62042.1 TolC family protein [Sinimarinibacterium sp. CAU 1509]
MYPRSRPRKVALSLLVMLVAATAAGFAQAATTPQPGAALTMRAALQAALNSNPALDAFAPQRSAAEALTLQAGLKPNPEIGIDVENFAGSGDYKAADSMEATLRLALALEGSEKRRARVAVARDGIVRIDTDYTLARLDVAADTARRFIDVVESQQQLQLAQHSADIAESVYAMADRRVRAGAASDLERQRAAIGRERALLEVEHYEHLLLTQRRWLAAQWGADSAEFSQAEANLLELPSLPEPEQLLAQLSSSPDYARYDIERRLRESELALARAQASGNPVLSTGVRRFERSNDVGLVATLLFPLPWSDRNQGRIAAAAAQRDLVEVQQRGALIHAKAALYDLTQELRHARTLVETLGQTLIPRADAALKATLRGYNEGRYSQLDVLDARTTALELERERVTNAADYHRFLAAIERMTALAPPDDATAASPAP